MLPLRRAVLHGLCFAMPLLTLAWGLTAPHPGASAWPWVAVLAIAIALDFHASPERSPPLDAPAWPFDAALYALSAIQLFNVALLARAVHLQGLATFDAWVGVLIVGASSGYSAIVVAHELVHRKRAHLHQLGRLLLCTVLYEHFATEHVRGHHKRIGTADDPATARFDEPLHAFLARTVTGQLRSAWAIESRRIGAGSWRDPAHARNRVVHGALVGWGALAAVALLLGPAPAAALLAQAAIAVLLLESVNYVEHWGLVRQGSRVTPRDSWDAEGWFTYYSLVGLSRHADHHAHASRPWQSLRCFDESPKMPWGYWAMVITAIFANGTLRTRLRAELARRRLGPQAA